MQVKVKLTSVSPVLMHNPTLANPLHPLTKEFKALTSARKKTDDQLMDIMKLEFKGGLYWDKETGPYIPDAVLLGSIRTAARFYKRGKDIERGVQILEDKIPFVYHGPKDPEGMYAQPEEYVDIRRVVVGGGATVMRCRPILKEWSAECTIMFDETVINKDQVLQYLNEAGQKAGIMDMRPRYGRFTAEVARG